MDKYPEFIDPYDQTTGNIFVRAEHLARYLFAAKYMQKHKLLTVLDAACGSGYGCRVLAPQAQAVMGIDRSQDLIGQAKRINGERFIHTIEYCKADLNDGLGFLAGSTFDCVTCYETLEHVEQDEKLLHEFRRVLRRGGRLLLSAPKTGYEPTGNDGKPVNPYHLRLYDAVGLKALLMRTGFAVEKTLWQPYANISRVNMEDFCRDKGIPYEVTGAYFMETPEAMEFYAKVWGWPVAELESKSNVNIMICRKE